MKIESFLKRSLLVPVMFNGRSLESHLQQSLKVLELNLLESLVLVSIFFEGRECRPSELAKVLHVSRPHISIAIRALLDRELVSRKISPGDARFVSLTLTAAGRLKAQKLTKIFDQINDRLEKSLGVRRSEEIAGGLFSLMETLRTWN